MQTITLPKRAALVTAAMCMTILPAAWAQPSPAEWNGLPLEQLSFGTQQVLIVSATNARERAIAFDKYATLQTGEGVLLAYEESGRRCLSTSDIPLDLDVAYLDEEGRVLETGFLVAAQSEEQCAKANAQQMLTVPKGQLVTLGLKVGDTLPATVPVTEAMLEEAKVKVEAANLQARSRQAAHEAQDRQTPPRIALNIDGKPFNPLLIFVYGANGMDSERERAKLAPEHGWLYVFETEVPANTCRNADQIHGQLWEQFKYRQHAFDRNGKLLGSSLHEDGKLCAGKGTMRYALVLPHNTPEMTKAAQLELAPALQTLARQRFDNVLLPGTTYYQHHCDSAQEKVESLLTIQDNAPDGSAHALFEVLVADGKNHLLENIKAEMKGVKNTDGHYVFTPLNLLATSKKYRLQNMTETGARPLDQLQVNLQGLQCNKPAAQFTYAHFDPKAWETASTRLQQNALSAQQKAVNNNMAFFEQNYQIHVTRKVGPAQINSGAKGHSSFLGALFKALVFGFIDENRDFSAWAYQCSNRTYTVTIRPKKNIPHLSQEKYPIDMNLTWSLVQTMDTGTPRRNNKQRTLKLPVKVADSVTDTLDFGCQPEHRRSLAAFANKQPEFFRFTEKSSELRLDGLSKPVLHRANFTGSINHNVIGQKHSEQMNELNKIIDKHNEGVRQQQAWRNSPAYAEAQRASAQRDMEKQLKDHEKRMKRQADCEREKRTGKMAYTMSSAC